MPAIGAVIAGDRLGKGIRTAPRDAIIGLSVDRSDLGVAFGVHRALDTAGAALGPVAAFAVLAFAPRAFDAVFVLSFALAVAGLASILLLVRNPGVVGSALSPAPATLATLLTLGRSSRFWTLSLGAATLALATVSDGFLYLGLQRVLGLDPAALPLMFAGTAAGYFVAAVPLGRAADRFGRRAVFLCGYVALLFAYVSVLAPSPAPSVTCALRRSGPQRHPCEPAIWRWNGSTVRLPDLRTCCSAARWPARALVASGMCPFRSWMAPDISRLLPPVVVSRRGHLGASA